MIRYRLESEYLKLVARYYINLPYDKQYAEENFKDYGTIPQTLMFAIDVDVFTEIVANCENNGVKIRDLLEKNFYNKSHYIDDYIGEIVYKAGILPLKSGLSSNLPYDKCGELGVILRKLFKVVCNFDICKARRNTDTFRYWCEFQMDKYPYIFEDMVMKGLYTDKMAEEAQRHVGIRTAVYMLNKVSEYIFDDLNVLINKDIYVKTDYYSIKHNLVYNKLEKLFKLLKLIHLCFIGRRVTDYINNRRVKRIFPVELYIGIIKNLEPYICRIAEINNYLRELRFVQGYIGIQDVNLFSMEVMSYLLNDIIYAYFSVIQVMHNIAGVARKVVGLNNTYIGSNSLWCTEEELEKDNYFYLVYGYPISCGNVYGPEVRHIRERIFI